MINLYLLLLVIFILILFLLCTRRRKRVAIYTCFFGGDNNCAFVINEPLLKYDSYYFTNNRNLFNKLNSTKWKPIFIDIPIKNDLTLDAFDSKKLKACPQDFKVLNKYDITIYTDSKLKLKENIYELIDEFEKTDCLYAIIKHPFLHNVWEEYNECLKQPRYEVEKEKYKQYINNKLDQGFKDKVNNHYATGFIIRKMTKKTNEINKIWYENIVECGIECQISFFFIQQMFNDFICPIEPDFYYST